MAKAYKEIFDEDEGVWRTIGGRRVFIKTGQSLSDAMKESGKFRQKGEDENAENENIRMEAGITMREKRILQERLSKEEYKKYMDEQIDLYNSTLDKARNATPEEKMKIWREYREKYYSLKEDVGLRPKAPEKNYSSTSEHRDTTGVRNNDLQSTTLKKRYEGTYNYLKKTTNMSEQQILEVLRRIEKREEEEKKNKK